MIDVGLLAHPGLLAICLMHVFGEILQNRIKFSNFQIQQCSACTLHSSSSAVVQLPTDRRSLKPPFSSLTLVRRPTRSGTVQTSRNLQHDRSYRLGRVCRPPFSDVAVHLERGFVRVRMCQSCPGRHKHVHGYGCVLYCVWICDWSVFF